MESSSYADMFGKSGTAMLSSLALDGDDRLILDTHIENLECIKNSIDKAASRIALRASENESVKILMSMTGIDYQTALLLASEIGDIARFPTPKKLVSWAGLCPDLNQSGESRYYGRMKKKDCNKRVQSAMMEAANVAARHDGRMKGYYEMNAGKMHHNKAIAKVANKMITIIWHMLTKKQMYVQRKDGLYSRKVNRMRRIAK
ncbi:MAG: transposase [Nitrososphaerales archaeon]